jgi:transglutaminase-like putative cysteine protease
MKRAAFFLAVLGDWLLLSFGVVGAVLCPITALNLSCDTRTLVGCIVLLCLLAALLNRVRHVWPVRLAALLLWAAYVVLARKSLWNTALELASTALCRWRPTYAWLGTFAWEPTTFASQNATTVLFLLAAVLLVLLLSWTALRRHSLYWTLPLTVPSLLVSMAAEDTLPGTVPLLLLLSFWLGLALTRVLRRNRDVRSRLAVLLLPCAACAALAGLYVACSPATYVRPEAADDLQRKLVQTLADSGSFRFSETQRVSQQLTDLDLDELDGGSDSDMTILRVRSSAAGQLYLRGYSLRDYGGNTWSRADGPDEYADHFSLLTAGDGTETLEIRSVTDTSGLLYVPYGLCGDLPEEAQLLGDYAIAYSGDSYTLTYGTTPELDDTAYAQSVMTVADYLVVDLDPDQLAVLTAIGDEIRTNAAASSVDALADAVAAYVRNSAVYDLDTPANPDGTDFTLYFLQESHRGYCIHFASATTLLLRNLGIPARYVTGFAVSVDRANTWVNVRASDAHAWTEYFDGTQWVPLESTPGYDEIASLATEVEEPEISPADAEPAEPEPSDTTPEPSVSPTVSPTPESSEVPEPTTSDTVSNVTATRYAPVWLSWVLAVLLAVWVVLLRAWVIRRERHQRFTQRDPAKAFAALWAYALRLERFGVTLPPEIVSLAEKARFSREGATEDDRRALAQFVRTQCRALYAAASRPRRLVLQFWTVL